MRNLPWEISHYIIVLLRIIRIFAADSYAIVTLLSPRWGIATIKQ